MEGSGLTSSPTMFIGATTGSQIHGYRRSQTFSLSPELIFDIDLFHGQKHIQDRARASSINYSLARAQAIQHLPEVVGPTGRDQLSEFARLTSSSYSASLVWVQTAMCRLWEVKSTDSILVIGIITLRLSSRAS